MLVVFGGISSNRYMMQNMDGVGDGEGEGDRKDRRGWLLASYVWLMNCNSCSETDVLAFCFTNAHMVWS